MDLTPLEPDVATGGTGGRGAKVPDGGVEGGEPGSTFGVCRACYSKVPECIAKEAQCNELPKCATLLKCMLDKGCFEGGPGEAANLCALPCVVSSGITSPVEDALLDGRAVTNCSENNCPGICFSSDAGKAKPP